LKRSRVGKNGLEMPEDRKRETKSTGLQRGFSFICWAGGVGLFLELRGGKFPLRRKGRALSVRSFFGRSVGMEGGVGN